MLTAGDGDPFPLIRSQGDEDPYPWAAAPGRWVRGAGSYLAYQIGPVVELIATGTIRINWTAALLAASPGGVFPPQYGLAFLVQEVQLPAEKPFTVQASFYSQNHVPSVIVWDAAGRHDVRVVKYM